MKSEQIKKIIEDHKNLIDKIMKKFDVTEEQAHTAINIACDFNMDNTDELFENLLIITYTIKHIEEYV